MKNYCALIFLIFLFLPDISMAQRYHIDLDDQQPQPGKTESRDRYSNPNQNRYRNRYKLNSKYPEKRYASRENRSPVFSIELNGGQSTFEARVLSTWLIIPSTVSFGINGLTASDDFYFVSSDLTVGNKMIDQKLSLEIGIRGLGGNVEKGRNESTIGVLGFLVKAVYDIPDIEVTYTRYLDLEIHGEFCASPSPVSFGDTEQYFEMRTGLGINLTENKQNTILVGYRYIKADFDDGRFEWDKTYDAFYFGYRIKF
ncbi:Uncharacterized protein dnl_55210 [Desulfonema limicola]|uniref:Outer membrane protein beta-barrel domain-containing protein n=1 Tax=Desulfonema limicola TaxID=45656 RepID=A0A975GJ12_9BACT|nr:hypothetical protein [Desulfonema limicola]QTA83127.1 Uncharacterized protein dnl_55210 [Desulfonema limicola]